MSNKIDESLGLTPYEEPPRQVTMVVAKKTDKQADIAYARDNLYDITMKGSTALADALALAKSSQDYHLYDSIAKLITATTNANINLIKLNEDDPEADKTSSEKTVVSNTMNFVGTSSDLIDMIMKKVQGANNAQD